jgi:hypothetical protein
MKKIEVYALITIIFIVSISCNILSPEPTQTPVPTQTLVPTSTSTATIIPTSTSTPEPTATSTNSPVPETEESSEYLLPPPSGVPAAKWEGIPIMPDAIAGEGDSTGYLFTIDSSPEEIQEYYEQELGKLGYNLFASGQGSTESIILFFMKGDESVAISIQPQPDGLFYVTLVK